MPRTDALPLLRRLSAEMTLLEGQLGLLDSLLVEYMNSSSVLESLLNGLVVDEQKLPFEIEKQSALLRFRIHSAIFEDINSTILSSLKIITSFEESCALAAVRPAYRRRLEAIKDGLERQYKVCQQSWEAIRETSAGWQERLSLLSKLNRMTVFVRREPLSDLVELAELASISPEYYKGL